MRTASRLLGAALCVCCLAPTTSAKSLDFAVGKALFDRVWTSSPASTDATDGLGPLFNARSCASCHPAGGRGKFSELPDNEISGPGLITRIAGPDGRPDPIYGQQLQTRAVQGLTAEGKPFRQEDGRLSVRQLVSGPLHPDSRVSGRLAPTLRGIGLLEQIPEAAIRAYEDPADRDGDGISGRANQVPSEVGTTTIGRFGWKAATATLRQQSAAALSNDLGLSTSLFPNHAGDCTEAQPRCLNAPHGASPRFDHLEVSDEMLRLIVRYVAGLKPPTPTSKQNKGLALFKKTGCAACHRPEMPIDSTRIIKPYSDLLLHEMGDDLADGISEKQATGTEWRTAPLWGLGKSLRYLHDGRAKTLEEAIELHGGEAARTRANFRRLPRGDKDQLLNFLNSL